MIAALTFIDALTAQLLKLSLNPLSWVSLSDSRVTESVDWTPWPEENVTSYCLDLWCQNHYPTIDILQYEVPEQQRVSNQPPNDSSIIYPTPYNESGLEKVSWAHFIRNSSTLAGAEDRGNSNIHYNSTLWFKNSSIQLSSPFLDVGYGCSGHTNFSTLGNCICYKGKPISLDLLNENQAICKTAPGYVWGFSSRLTVLGMALEAAWMGSCFILYLYLSLRCKCIRNETVKAAGNIRLAMDLTESVQRDLGEDATYMPEKQAKEKLKYVRIGYKPEVLTSNQIVRYRLVSGLPDNTVKERVEERLRFGKHLRTKNMFRT